MGTGKNDGPLIWVHALRQLEMALGHAKWIQCPMIAREVLLRNRHLEVCDEAETCGEAVGARVQRGNEHCIENGCFTPTGLPQAVHIGLFHLPWTGGQLAGQSGTVPCPDLPLLLQDRFPGTIRIESIHFNKLIEGGRPKILLVDNAVVADDEGLHAEIPFADWCRGSLTFQNLEEIAMIWLGTAGVALFDRSSNLFANRSAPTTIRVLPCQAILLAWSAYSARGVLVRIVAFTLLECVFVLCFHVAAADVNGVQFIASDATVEEFLAAGFGIKRPFGAQLNDWHGERPVLVAHQEECPVPLFRIHGDAFLFASFCSEVSGSLPVLWVFTGKNYVLATGAENLSEKTLVKLPSRSN